jgi:hypothetical protein
MKLYAVLKASGELHVGIHNDLFLFKTEEDAREYCREGRRVIPVEVSVSRLWTEELKLA